MRELKLLEKTLAQLTGPRLGREGNEVKNRTKGGKVRTCCQQVMKIQISGQFLLLCLYYPPKATYLESTQKRMLNMSLERMFSDFEDFVICSWGVRKGFTTPQCGNSLGNRHISCFAKAKQPNFLTICRCHCQRHPQKRNNVCSNCSKGRGAKLNVGL